MAKAARAPTRLLTVHTFILSYRADAVNMISR
jgi:hypothetical protein